MLLYQELLVSRVYKLMGSEKVIKCLESLTSSPGATQLGSGRLHQLSTKENRPPCWWFSVAYRTCSLLMIYLLRKLLCLTAEEILLGVKILEVLGTGLSLPHQAAETRIS